MLATETVGTRIQIACNLSSVYPIISHGSLARTSQELPIVGLSTRFMNQTKGLLGMKK